MEAHARLFVTGAARWDQEERFRELFRDELFRDEPFLEEERFPPVLRELDFLEELLRGTFAPFARASDSPMAIACLRLFTVPPFPPRPLFSVPFFRRRIALPTLLLAARPYFRVPDFLPDFFLVAMKPPGSSQRISSTRRALCKRDTVVCR